MIISLLEYIKMLISLRNPDLKEVYREFLLREPTRMSLKYLSSSGLLTSWISKLDVIILLDDIVERSDILPPLDFLPADIGKKWMPSQFG